MGSLNLEKIMEYKAFYHLYQPLYRLADWKLCGYEAFLRTEFMDNPEVLFRIARESGKLYGLDISSISQAVHSYQNKYKNSNLKLFINVFPSTLVHKNFLEFLDRFTSALLFQPQNIVFEINEAEEINDFNSIKQAISLLKTYGYHIALDDVGKGFYSFRHLVELEVDFIKLDRYFSFNLSKSERKQRVVKSLVEYCDKDIFLILEGIENAEDLTIAKMLKVPIAQGYLLGKPSFL
jgi:EAL domain-containing protein (putative c-di-GMP-specific phosphodiesterase class I)